MKIHWLCKKLIFWKKIGTQRNPLPPSNLPSSATLDETVDRTFRPESNHREKGRGEGDPIGTKLNSCPRNSQKLIFSSVWRHQKWIFGTQPRACSIDHVIFVYKQWRMMTKFIINSRVVDDFCSFYVIMLKTKRF